MASRFGTDFRRFFVRGLAAVLPPLATVALLLFFFGFVDAYMGRFLNAGLQWVVVQLSTLIQHEPWSLRGPEGVREEVRAVWETYRLNWAGLVLAFVAIYVVGRFVASWLGRTIWHLLETGLLRIPVFKQIYPYVKQVTDFLLNERRMDVSRVVAVEYPRKGIWSLGLATGAGLRALEEAVEDDLITVFIPSSPTPVTGYTITVRRADTIELPLSLDEALRFTVSGGVVVPSRQKGRLSELEEARRRLHAAEAASASEAPSAPPPDNEKESAS